MFNVIRISTGANCGTHSTWKLAVKRIHRLVAMSNGKLTTASFYISHPGAAI